MQEKIAYIYHNPRCSKSRAALAILQDKNIPLQIIDYLLTPPTLKELQNILLKLNLGAESLLRKNEEVFKDHYKDKMMSDEDILQTISSHPILLERPLIIYGERAIIGRPPERVLEIL